MTLSQGQQPSQQPWPNNLSRLLQCPPRHKDQVSDFPKVMTAAKVQHLAGQQVLLGMLWLKRLKASWNAANVSLCPLVAKGAEQSRLTS